MNTSDYIKFSPKDFELQVFSYLKEIGNDLENFEIQHDIKEIGVDGKYQIDVKVTFEVLGVKMKILVECKHHKSPIKRDVIEILKNRIQSTGAQKGILFSTSEFQSGCIEFAEKNGIALVRLIKNEYRYEIKGLENIKFFKDRSEPKIIGEYIYDKNGDYYTTYYIQKGWIDGLKDFILK